MVIRRYTNFVPCIGSHQHSAGHPLTWISSGYHRAAPEVHTRHYHR